MKTIFLAGSLLAGFTMSAGAATLSGSTGYALSSDGQSIVILSDLGSPDTTRTLTLQGGSVDALSYRPFTGQLYGYSAGSAEAEQDQVFLIDTDTGELTSPPSVFSDGIGGISSTAQLGFDFNNSLDATRIISTDGDNLVFFPDDTASENANAGTVIRATSLFFNVDDVNEGATPEVFANAYTNALDGQTADTTLQFAIDAATDTLVTLDNNAGSLNTVAGLTVDGLAFDVTSFGGFEILSEALGDNLGVALLQGTSGTSGLYTIDLDTGVTDLFADLGDVSFSSFAAQTAPAPVPLPAAGLLLLAGLGGLGVARRFRKS